MHKIFKIINLFPFVDQFEAILLTNLWENFSGNCGEIFREVVESLLFLRSFPLPFQCFICALDLSFEALDASVVAGRAVDFAFAVAGLAAGRGGSLDEVGIMRVVLLLGFAFLGHIGPQVDEAFAVIFYAHGVRFLIKY